MKIRKKDINEAIGNGAFQGIKRALTMTQQEVIDEVLASGDQDNDIELLKSAGIKVCVGDNSAQLKEVATHYCKSVNSDELVDLVGEMAL